MKVIIEQTAREGPCPACGVLSAAVKDRPLVRVKDLPASGQPMELWWRKRRLVVRRGAVPAAVVHPDLVCGAAAGRVTERLRRPGGDRDRVGQPGRRRCRRRVRRVVADRAQGAGRRGGAVAARADTDERCWGSMRPGSGSVRWILDGITWKRSDPWLTSFVDCSVDGPGSLLGLAPGRTGGCVQEWLAEQIRGSSGTRSRSS